MENDYKFYFINILMDFVMCVDNYSPDKSKKGTAIQLYAENNPFLVIGPEPHPHGWILEKFLRKEKIRFKRRRDFYPHLEGDGYKVTGAGISTWTDEKRILLGGLSYTYLIGIDEKHVEDLNKRIHDLKIEIE